MELITMHKTAAGESKGSEEGGPGSGQESKSPEGSGGNHDSGQGYSSKATIYFSTFMTVSFFQGMPI